MSSNTNRPLYPAPPPPPRKFKGHVTFSNVAVMLLAFVVLGGGAYAAGSVVTARSIARDAVTSPKVKDHSLKAKDFADGQVPAGPQGPKGDPGAQGETGATGADGPPGLQGETGATGPAGSARAYGLVDSVGNLTNSHGISGVTNPNDGVFCITLAPGIDPESAVALVAPDFSNDSTTFDQNSRQAVVEWDSAGCGNGDLAVFTGFRSQPLGGGASQFVTRVDITSRNQGFSILVP